MSIDEGRFRLVALLLIGVAFLVGAGGSITNSTDAVYAAVIQDAAFRGNWLTPGVAGGPYLMKPLGWFWAGAASISVFGETAFAYRVPNLISGWATIALVAAMGGRLARSPKGWWAALVICLLAPTFVEFTRRVYMEVPLALTQVAILYCAIRALDEEDPKWLWGVGLITAAGVLVKSYAGGFAATAVLIYLAAFGPRRWLLSKPWLGGIAVGSVILGIWLAVMLSVAPEPFIDQMTAPFRLSSDEQYSWYRTGTFFYLTKPLEKNAVPFVAGLAAMAFFAWQSWQERKAHPGLLVALYTAVLLGIYWQLSQQRLYYLVPLFPAMAAVAGAAAARLPLTGALPKVLLGAGAAAAVAMNAYVWSPKTVDLAPDEKGLAAFAGDLPEGVTVYRYDDFFAATELYLRRRTVQLTSSDSLLKDLGRVLTLGERGIAADGKPPAVYTMYRQAAAGGQPFFCVFNTGDLQRFGPGLPGLSVWGKSGDLWLVSSQAAPKPGPELPPLAPVGYDVAAAWLDAQGLPAEAAALRAQRPHGG